MSENLTREAILAADDLPCESVDVPEWGGPIWVRTMTGAQRDQFEQKCQASERAGGKLDLRGIRALLVVLTASDQGGKLLFTAGDIPALQEKSARALDRVFTASSKLNGIGAQDVEDLAENFGGDRKGSSGSD